MSYVVAYNADGVGGSCFCQIKLDSGERVLISMSGYPYVAQIMKVAFGAIPTGAVWKCGNPGPILARLFPHNKDWSKKGVLDLLRNELLKCQSIAEVKELLGDGRQSLSKEEVEKLRIEAE